MPSPGAGGASSPPLQPAGRAAHARASEAAHADIQAVTTLEEQTRRLDQHLEAVETAPPTRNLFRFGSRPVARRPLPPPPAVALAPVVPPPAPAPFPLRLTGIAVQIVNGAERRTAILSGPSGVELAATGEMAAPGYRVVDVGEGFAEVERTSDGAREKLTLRP